MANLKDINGTINFASVSNPRYANAEHTIINCDVEGFSHLSAEAETMEFTADPNDYMLHGREIFARCIAGEFGEVKSYVDYHGMDFIREWQKNLVRRLRPPMLSKLDVAYTRASELADIAEGDALTAANELKRSIALQRKALRDMTTNPALNDVMTREQIAALVQSAAA